MPDTRTKRASVMGFASFGNLRRKIMKKGGLF